jgi:hypothetical protein
VKLSKDLKKMDEFIPGLFEHLFVLVKICEDQAKQRGRGRRWANPYRNHMIYLMVTVFHMKCPDRPQLTWKRCYELMANIHSRNESEQKVIAMIEWGCGIYFKQEIPISTFFRALGKQDCNLQFNLGVSAMRAAYNKGKKLFELVKEKQLEWADKLARYSVTTMRDPDGNRMILVSNE